MIENIEKYESLTGLARLRFKHFITKAIHKADLDKFKSEGWEYVKNLKTSIQVRKEKPHNELLEDRVWSLFYKMKFPYLSTDKGAKLVLNPKDSNGIKSQIDLLAIDKEIALAVECKSSTEYKRRPQFQEELGKFVQIKEPLTKAIKSKYSEEGTKKQVVLVMFFNKIILSDNDKERAKKSNVILFDEKDLAYYENLVGHLGPAAKYQVLADMLPGKDVPGLTIRIPAIKAKMGGYNCYSFSISPEYLLKVSYVSHRSKGKASDINTYQRMLAKARLKKIKEYISDDGIFPTNIILNFERGRLSFEKIKQTTDVDDNLEVGVLGWLDIRPAYKSAWIIDGQHRLFAYSGHEKALKSKLVVLAFEGLKPSKQAELFIDINAKQKSVKLSLLQELFAELHWDAEDPSIRISAIISKAIQDLNNDPECMLYQRIQSTDGQRDEIRCITLTSLFGQIEKKGFFIVREKHGSIIEYGPLWGGDENEVTLKRTKAIIKAWINIIAGSNKDWWNIGSGEGGGLAMNDGLASLISVLRSVFEFLESKGYKFLRYSDAEVVEVIKPYGEALGKYLSTLDESKRKAFRDLRGVAGVTFRTRQCQQGIRLLKSDFSPDGLDEWINLQKQQTNKSAKEIIDVIEVKLQKYIINELKDQFGNDSDVWWYEGVPSSIRSKATARMEDDKNRRGGKEYYFDLIDYRKIVSDNWELFEKMLGFGKGGKDKRTEWIEFINETRKIVAHASSGKTVSIEDFARLEEYYRWFQAQMSEPLSFE
ncbi:DGQHR domain-containing protein [Terrimonas pollutisoli]|uniref:DGQHR domain-containing protein n=1 Tax=Terrimonas pollutisoli TaxID=3034147 RepID=UPI0023ECD88E|nr:DGQHR domain-containing protein [Terrimonas sp. H1YJ31]